MTDENGARASRSYTPILIVLFLEYLAISLTKSIVPKLLVDTYGSHTYMVFGVTETVKGILAFLNGPAIGKLSDRIGRKPCVLITVVGTCALVLSRPSLCLFCCLVGLLLVSAMFTQGRV